MLRLVQFVRSVQESLGGNASDVQAGATEGTTLLNASSFQPSLPRFDGSNVAAWSTTDNDKVVLFVGESRHSSIGEKSGGDVGLPKHFSTEHL